MSERNDAAHLDDMTEAKPRFSRPCYDKPHRCPGWAGGGMKYAQAERCTDGRITVSPTRGETAWLDYDPTAFFNPHPGAHPLRFGTCSSCNVRTLPYAVRFLDPTYLRWAIPHRVRTLVQDLRWKWNR